MNSLTYENWKQSVAEAKSRGWKLTNCYFLPKALQLKIDAGVLSLRWIENGLILLEDAGSFYRCYYYLSPDDRPGRLELDRDGVVEFPFTGEMNRNQLLQVELLRSLGFELGRESGLMTCRPDDLISRCSTTEEVRPAIPEQAEEIYDLLYRTFDPRYAFLPSMPDLITAIREGMVFVISWENRVAAALISGVEKNIAGIQQVAVEKSAQGCGLGKTLLEAYHQKYAKQVTAFQHWVDLHNSPALKMYRSFGYTVSLRKANEYILSPKTKDLL